jgi:hypothetical protein
MEKMVRRRNGSSPISLLAKSNQTGNFFSELKENQFY